MFPDCAREPDGLALLRAAVADPAEATPWLMLMDWLLEQGEYGLVRDLRHSRREFTGDFCGHSFAGEPLTPDDANRRWEPLNFSLNGFPGVRLSVSDQLARLPDSPWITVLDCPRPCWAGARLADLGRRDTLAALCLNQCPVSDADLRALESPELAVLWLHGSRITDAGLEAISAWHTLADLDLRSTAVTDAGVKRLAALPRLTALNLDSTAVTDAGLDWLATRTGLTHISLGQTAVTDVTARTLAALPHLEYLWLPETVSSACLDDLRKALPFWVGRDISDFYY